MFWQGMGMLRPGRRRGGKRITFFPRSKCSLSHAEDDGLDIFGRQRTTSTSIPEGTVHPLLLDPNTAAPASHSRSSRRTHRSGISGFPQDLLHSIEHVIGEGAMQLFQHIIAGRGGAGETIRIDVPAGGLIPQLGRHGRSGVSAHIRLERAPRSGDARSDARTFEPLLTRDRWAEEVKTLHGRFEQSRVMKLVNHVILAMLPAAIEAYKKAKIEEEKEAAKRREAEQKAEEEAAKKREEEEKARLEEERAKAEKERLEAEARAAAEAEAQTEVVDADAEMVDVTTSEEQPSGSGEAEPQAGSSQVQERVTVMIHGNPVDITDTGIDPTFLEALPDDMREEVLNQHVRDLRAARVERPVDSQISPEFLDALPPELRAEIIQQENLERARRQAQPPAAAAAAAPPAPPAVPAEMDPADFLASLDPQLRQTVLMDSDDVFIQALPPHMLAEVGLFREGQPRIQLATRGGPAQHGVPRRAQIPASPAKPSTPRVAIQLLDKHAIAVLIRLLFFPQVLRKNILSKVLVNLSENAKTRTDIFNLLLGILQDGTGDLSAIDRSFAQMSFRNAKSTPQVTPRPAGKLALPQPEVVPELVAQRCLDALTYITATNEASSVFFVTEQELPVGLRRSSSKKGKGKEKQAPQTYYPIVLLLGQLDKQALLRTPSLMESIVGLLSLVSRPLTSLKDAEKKESKPEASTSGQASSSEQQPEPSTVAPAQAAQPDNAGM